MVFSLIALLLALGLVISAFGFISSTWVDVILMGIPGVGNGYMALFRLTWMQTRAPQEMLGRVMSPVMHSDTDLVPISQAILGP